MLGIMALHRLPALLALQPANLGQEWRDVPLLHSIAQPSAYMLDTMASHRFSQLLATQPAYLSQKGRDVPVAAQQGTVVSQHTGLATWQMFALSGLHLRMDQSIWSDACNTASDRQIRAGAQCLGKEWRNVPVASQQRAASSQSADLLRIMALHIVVHVLGMCACCACCHGSACR